MLKWFQPKLTRFKEVIAALASLDVSMAAGVDFVKIYGTDSFTHLVLDCSLIVRDI